MNLIKFLFYTCNESFALALCGVYAALSWAGVRALNSCVHDSAQKYLTVLTIRDTPPSSYQAQLNKARNSNTLKFYNRKGFG